MLGIFAGSSMCHDHNGCIFSVGYILNVTNEVDCFFPAHFKYLKILVSDEANTELLMYWQVC